MKGSKIDQMRKELDEAFKIDESIYDDVSQLAKILDEEHVDDAVLRLHKELFANAGNFPEVFE